MDQISDEDEQQRRQHWILEHFSPATGPTRPKEEEHEVRFGLGELDLPGLPLSRWAIVRGLVWALREVAPDAWGEIKVLAQEAVDELLTQVIPPDEPDWRGTPEEPDQRDQLFQTHAVRLLRDTDLPLETLGLGAEDGEIPAATPERQPLIVPNPLDFQAWRDKWNLANDRSLFTVAVLAAAVTETDQFRPLSATNIAWVTFASLFASVLPNASEIPGVEGSLAESLEAALAPPYPQAIRFEMPRFNPFFETEATFKATAYKALECELDAHIKACRAALMSQAIAPVPTKREPDKHFRCYIRFQVLEQSLGEIAKAECIERDSVFHAVNAVVKIAGVPKRKPNRPGRKKKAPPSGSELSG